MLERYKTRTNVGVGVGVGSQLVGGYLMETEGGSDVKVLVGMALFLLGLVFFVWGCISYAAGKGQNKALGLLGLLSCVGLVILVILPDHHREL